METTRTHTNRVLETTRAQDEVIERVALRWGRAAVSQIGYTHEHNILVVGMTDDIERCHLWVYPNGFTRKATENEMRLAAPSSR